MQPHSDFKGAHFSLKSTMKVYVCKCVSMYVCVAIVYVSTYVGVQKCQLVRRGLRVLRVVNFTSTLHPVPKHGLLLRCSPAQTLTVPAVLSLTSVMETYGEYQSVSTYVCGCTEERNRKTRTACTELFGPKGKYCSGSTEGEVPKL